MTAAIALANVTHAYGTRPALSGVNLQVAEGQCFGLIGPNGAGKTTTFSLLCGFLRPTSGSVQVWGVDPSAPNALRGRLGALPQDSELPGTLRVADFLEGLARLQGLGRPDLAAADVLAQVSLSDQARTPCAALSHGMAKRVNLAQALLGSPPLLILDEPTAGLDPKLAASVRDLVAGLKGRCTVVISSHNLAELEQLCDAAAVLDRGRVVASGPMSELTGAKAEFRIDIASGHVPLDELRLLSGVQDVARDASGWLVVRHASKDVLAEDVISGVLLKLLRDGVKVRGVARGHSLEKTVLSVTE